jgi:hypothetical protein
MKTSGGFIEINKVARGLKNFNIKKLVKLNKSKFFSEEQVRFFKYFSKSILRFDRRSYRYFSKLRYWFRNFRPLQDHKEIFTLLPSGNQRKAISLQVH